MNESATTTTVGDGRRRALCLSDDRRTDGRATARGVRRRDWFERRIELPATNASMIERVEDEETRRRTRALPSSSSPSSWRDDEEEDTCRFCRRSEPPASSSSRRVADALVLVGCDCRDADLARAHPSCAFRWFAPRARGVATGFALDKEWNLAWTCECEVCLAPLGADLLRDVVDACKRAVRADADGALRRRRFSEPSGAGER